MSWRPGVLASLVNFHRNEQGIVILIGQSVSFKSTIKKSPGVPGQSPGVPGQSPSVPGQSPSVPGQSPGVPGRWIRNSKTYTETWQKQAK